MLPHVLRFNYAVNAERQKLVTKRWAGRAPRSGGAGRADRRTRPAAHLRDAGVSAELLDRIARKPCTIADTHQPAQDRRPATVRQLLDAAW